MFFELMLWNTPPLDWVCLFWGRHNELREKYFPDLQFESLRQRIKVLLDNTVLGFFSGFMFWLVSPSNTIVLPLLLVAVFLASVLLAKVGLYFPREFGKLSIGKLSLLMATSLYHVSWYFSFGLFSAIILGRGI